MRPNRRAVLGGSRISKGTRVLVAAAGVTTLVASGCGSSSSHSSAASSAPGVTSKQITLGLVTSVTGPAAANFNGAQQGVQARIDLQNAEGGVDGRMLKLDVGDDESSVQQAQTAVSSLVQTSHVFSLIFVSDLVSSGYRLAQEQSVPVVGAPIDGPEWGTKPNTNMVSVQGDQGPNLAFYSYYSKVAKSAGATNMADLAIANEDPSIVLCQEFANAAKAVGLNIGYKNYSIPIGTVDVGPTVLSMANAHVDGFFSAMLNTTDFAIMTAASQSGLKLVAPMDETSYTQDVLNSPTTLAAAQGIISSVAQVPVEEHTAATKAEQAAFEKYENFSGVPNLNWTYGWLSADLTIKGLEEAGKNVTRTSFLNAVRNTKGWTANGLLAQAPDFSLADFGHAPATSCGYFVQLKGKAFIPLNNGKPFCGDLENS